MAQAPGRGRQADMAWLEAYPLAEEDAEGGADTLAASSGDGNWQDAYPEAPAAPSSRRAPAAGPAVADAAPAEPAPQRSFLGRAARGLGLGARDVIEGAGASLPGLAYDAAAAPLNLLAMGLGAERAPIGSASEHAASLADLLGLPKPETTRERLQSRVGREVAGAGLSMGAAAPVAAMRGVAPAVRTTAAALADQPVAQVSGAAAAGLAGGATREAGGGDFADLAVALPAGVAGAALPGAVTNAVRGIGAAFAPLTRGGRRQIVGNTMLSAASRPEDLAGRLSSHVDEIPGSRQTTAEVSGDEGLFALERSLRSSPEGGPEFAARDAARDVARRRAVGAVEPVTVPETGAIDDVVGATGRAPEFQGSVRRAVAQRTDEMDAEIARAADEEARRRAALPARGDPGAQGAAIREPMAEGAGEARAANSAAYEGIDPGGDTRIPMDWVRAAADDVEGTYWGELSGGMPRPLREAVDELRSVRDEVPWASLQRLRSRLGKLSQDDDARVVASAARLTRAIDETAEGAARPRQMAGRAPTPEGLDLEEARQGLAGRPDVDAVLDDMRGASREAREGGISLVQFLRRDPARAPGQARGTFGGIRDPDGHLRAIVDDPRRMPGLIDQRGRSYEEAMQAAIDAGYFPGRTLQHDALNPGATLSRDEFLEAIGDELGGRRRLYPPGVAGARDNAADMARLRQGVDQELDQSGTSLHEGRTAVGRALREQPENAPAAPMDRPDGTVVIPEENRFTPEQAARWREATEGRADIGRRFESGPVGDVLRTQQGRYQVPDSGVAQRFFRAGSGSQEAADQFISALADAQGGRSGGKAGAERALYAYATQAMEDYASKPGGPISPQMAQRWMRQHARALTRFPDLRQRLNRWIDQAATREDLTTRRVAWGKEQERGALRAILNMEPEEAVASIMRSSSGETNVRQILDVVGNHPGAVRALRRAWLDQWMSSASGAVDAQMRERLSPAQARRFVENTQRAAEVLFSPGQWRRIQQINADLQSATRVSNVGRAIGSNTMQNASTAYFLSRLSGGVLAPESGASRLMGSTVGKVMGFIAQLPAEQVRRLMIEAAADPALARELVLEATPQRAEQAARAMARMADPDRLAAWMRDATVREGARAAITSRAGQGEERRRPEASASP